MKQFFLNLLDWIYKKKCYFCRSSYECVKMCSKCYDSLEFLSYDKRFATNSVPIYCAGVYEKNLQKLIRGLKYHNQKDLAFYQAKFMWEYWQNISDNENYTVIPVPLHRNRQNKRHYNHMELVAQEFCRLSGYQLNTNLVTRIKDTKPQYKLTREQRTQNLHNAFIVNKKEIINDRILIIDDICTTGSTFEEITKCLQQAGFNDITCFATTTPIN